MSIDKKAKYRTKSTNDCPFGLPISQACRTAGDCIERMVPIAKGETNGERSKIKKANQRTFLQGRCSKRCPFADQVGKNLQGVVCTFGENAAGIHSPNLAPSSLYPSIWQGVGGFFSFPMQNITSYYDNTFRNSPFGLFSLQGSQDNNRTQDRLKKVAKSELPKKAFVVLSNDLKVEGHINNIDYDALSTMIDFRPLQKDIDNSDFLQDMINDNNELNICIGDLKYIGL